MKVYAKGRGKAKFLVMDTGFEAKYKTLKGWLVDYDACQVFALSNCLGIPLDKAMALLSQFGWSLNSPDHIGDTILRALGWSMWKPKKKQEFLVRNVALPLAYVICIDAQDGDGHAVCVKDGVVLDTWDSRKMSVVAVLHP